MDKFTVVVSQGRVADKTPKTILGAERIAKEIENRYGVVPRVAGVKGDKAIDDDWAVSLPQARKTLNAVRDAIELSVTNPGMSVLISNTCSVSLGSLPVVARHYPDVILLWVDAHGDFNTPNTSDSGYLGGMVVAAACGLWDSGHGSGLRGNQVIVVGGRDIDADEKKLMREAEVRVLAPIDATPDAVCRMIGDSKVWIHVDWDVLEPGFVHADYKVSGGVLPLDLRAIIEALPKKQVVGLELAEFQMPDDEREVKKAIANIFDIVSPLLD